MFTLQHVILCILYVNQFNMMHVFMYILLQMKLNALSLLSLLLLFCFEGVLQRSTFEVWLYGFALNILIT